jgi:hypothetical protein
MEKPKRELTPEQLEALKARLIKAREAKIAKDKSRYEGEKETIKQEGLKKRTMNKVKTLLSKGAIKDEELKEILPKKEEIKQIEINKVVDEIVKETPFEKPLPKKRVPKPKPAEQPAVIPFEEELPKPKPSKPININKTKEPKFMKLIYYSEPSKKTMKKLSKMQESSSSDSDSESSDDELVVKTNTMKQVLNNEDEYYKQLARKFYG